MAHLESGGPLEERVRSSLHTLFGWTEQHPFAWRLLFGDDTTGDPHVTSIHRATKRRANGEVAERVLSRAEATTAEDLQPVEMIGRNLGGDQSLVRWWHRHTDV